MQKAKRKTETGRMFLSFYTIAETTKKINRYKAKIKKGEKSPPWKKQKTSAVRAGKIRQRKFSWKIR